MNKSDASKSLSITKLASAVLDSQDSLESQIKELKKELEEKEIEIAKLKEALTRSLQPSGFALPVSDESEIASIQLSKLKTISRERTLTYEEVKMLELLTKVKLSTEGDTINAKSSKLIEKGKKDLMKLVSPAKKEIKDGTNKS